MKHRVREIAAQAGLSQATVDRVLHHRGGVRESTVREIHQAIAALDRQQSEPAPPGSTVPIDVLVRDQSRVEAALRAELPGLRPAVLRPRLHPAADPLAALARIARSRSRGLILEAAETPELVEAVGRLEIPVVTFRTDLPASKRVAHVGPDEHEAGATAAYLIEQWLADRAGDVLVVTTERDSGGDLDDRVGGFRAELRSRAPNRRLLLAAPTQVRAHLAAHPSIRAVYAPQGGTTTLLADFVAEHRNYDVFVAHDLDDENTELLRSGHLSAVLHHDLRADLRSACLAILQTLGALPGPVRSVPAGVQVITPLNVPNL